MSLILNNVKVHNWVEKLYEVEFEVDAGLSFSKSSLCLPFHKRIWTEIYCVKTSVKFSNNIVKKKDFLEIINLFVLKLQKISRENKVV